MTKAEDFKLFIVMKKKINESFLFWNDSFSLMHLLIQLISDNMNI